MLFLLGMMSVTISAQGSMTVRNDSDSLIMVSANYLATLENFHQFQEFTPQMNDDITARSAEVSRDSDDSETQFLSSYVAKEHLELSLPDSKEFKLELRDQNNEVIMSHPSIFGDNQIYIGHLPGGTYQLILHTESENITERFIKF